MLISVYERKSVGDYEKDGGERFGKGLLFSILKYTQAQHEMFLSTTSDGLMIFANDDDSIIDYK